MASQDGSQAQGTNSVTRSFTAGALGVLHVKWENSAVPNSSFSDGTDTWTLAGYRNIGGSGEPGSAIFYCLSMSAASRTITPTFASGTPTYRSTECESFISSTGSWTTDVAYAYEDEPSISGAHTYSMASKSVGANSVSIFGVAEYTNIGTLSDTGGSPAFNVTAGVNASEPSSFMVWLIQASAGSITPGARTTASSNAVKSFASFKEVASATREQEGFRFGADDGSESAHTWLDAQDTNVSVALDTNFLYRALINATGDPASTAYTLRAQKNGSGGYTAVKVGASTSPTLSWGAAGTIAYSASGGTSVAPTYPSGITTNSGLVLVVGQKPSSANGGTVTTPSGWTLQGELSGANDGDTGGYTTTLAADQGNCNIFVYTKDSVSGSESGTLSVTVGTNDVCWANIYRIEASDTATWSWQCGTGKDTSAGNVSIATGSMSISSGDFILGGMVIPTDVTTPAQFSAEALSQSGTTFGTVTEVEEPDSGTGNDIGGFIIRAPVSSGSGSGAVTMTATAGGTTTNVRGPGFVLRARVSSVTNEIYVATSSNITAGGEATTARLTAPSGKSTSDFVTGRRWDDENGSDSIDITTDDYTEAEWCLRMQSPATNGDYWDLRVYAGSSALDTYTVTGRVTVAASGSSPTATASLSAAIQQALSATASVGAAVQTSGGATAGVAAAVQINRTVVASADAAVQYARTATAAADAAVQALQSVTASVTAYIQAGGQVSASLGAAVQAASTATASIGAAIQAGRTASVSLGAALQTSGAASSALGAAVQAALAATASLGAALQGAKTATVGVTAYVQAGSVVVAQLDAAIQAARTAAAGVDAAVQQARTATASLSAAIATTRTVTTGLAAAIAAPLSMSASIQAAVRAALSTNATLGAYVSDPTIPVFSAPSRLRIGAVGEAVDAVRLGPATAKPAARIGSADESVGTGRIGPEVQ